MQKIKFRVWDKEENKFRDNCSIKCDGTVESSWGKEKYDWVVQFWTGLLDKNNKEIYEGDIVAFEPSYADVMINGDGLDLEEVCFDNGAFGFKTGIHFLPLTDYIITHLKAEKYIDGKVIGNIFENPELLK